MMHLEIYLLTESFDLKWKLMDLFVLRIIVILVFQNRLLHDEFYIGFLDL